MFDVVHQAASSVFVETLGTVCGALFISIVGVGYRRIVAANKRQEEFYADFGKLKDVVLGEEPTEYNRFPAPGLYATVREQGKSIAAITRAMTRVETGTQELVADKRTNGGGSTKDQLNRIEERVTPKEDSE